VLEGIVSSDSIIGMCIGSPYVAAVDKENNLIDTILFHHVKKTKHPIDIIMIILKGLFHALSY